MAFYKDMDKQKKKTNHGEKGSWDDEGAHYSTPAKGAYIYKGNKAGTGTPGAKPARSAGGAKPYGENRERPRREGPPSPSQRRFGPDSVQASNSPQRPVKPAARPVGARPEGRKPRPQEGPKKAPAYAQYEFKPAPLVVMEEANSTEHILSGRNPIREALKNGRDIEKLLVARGELTGSAKEIVAMAKEARIPVQEVDRARLNEITPNHQGMLAFASAFHYSTVEEMLELAAKRKEDPFLILLDGITDPHNLGAIIRTAECVGAHGVIVPTRRAVGLTPAAVKASAGAIEYMKVARVVNLTRTLEELKEKGLWIFAADTEGDAYGKTDFSGPMALVIGAEGEGISRLVRETCDKVVSLPIKGHIDSLNASVAAGVLMYAVLQGREGK